MKEDNQFTSDERFWIACWTLAAITACTLIVAGFASNAYVTTKAFQAGYEEGSLPGQSASGWVKAKK